MGGTGKTPMALWLFNELILKHKKPCIVTRGYGRVSKELIVIDKNKIHYTADEIGDEPLMMLKSHKDMKMVVLKEARFLSWIRTTKESREVTNIHKLFEHIQLHLNLKFKFSREEAGNVYSNLNFVVHKR